jgi:DNA-binding XRE family transcriptional regulator
MSDLSDKIFMYRARHRLTQTEMAKRCGISLSTLCAVEKRDEEPSAKTLIRIMDVLKGENDEGQHITN